MSHLDRIFLWTVRVGIVLLLFTPLIVIQSFFFPFITGKNFFFRIVVEIVFMVWVALATVNPDFRPQKSPLLWALALFFSVVTLATLFSINPYHSFWSSFERMEGLITHLHLFALFLVLGHVLRSTKEWFYFFNVSLFISFIAAIYSFMERMGFVVATEFIGSGRLIGTLGNSIYLAVYMMFHLFIIAALFSRVRLWWLRLLYAVLFLFEFSIFFIAASRGAFVGFVAGVFVMALFLLFFSQKRLYRFAAIAVLAVLIALLGTIVLFPESAAIQKSQFLHRLSSLATENFKNDSRFMVWGIAWETFKEKPLLGWGPENFIVPFVKHYNPNLFGHEMWFDRVHNMLLEWLVATGIIGFLLYLGIFMSVGIILWRLFHNHVFDYFFTILMIGFFTAYIVQNVFIFDNIVTFTLVFSIFAFLHSCSLTRRSPKKDDVKKKDFIIKQRQIIISASVLILGVFLVPFFNLKPMYAANQTISALSLLSESNNLESFISEFDEVVTYNTFGSMEAREHLADIVLQIGANVDQRSSAFLSLLNYSIQELEKAVTLDLHYSTKPLLILGKLYTFQAGVQGDRKSFERAEAVYKHLILLAPRYVPAYLGLAESYLTAGENGKAIAIAKKAFSLPDQDSVALGALFDPVFSVYVFAGDFPGAVEFLAKYSKHTGAMVIGPLSDDLTLLIQRINDSSDLAGRLIFFKELNQMYIDYYGFSHPRVVREIIKIYEGLGQDIEAEKAAMALWNPEYEKKARDHAAYALAISDNPAAGRALVTSFLEEIEALR